MISRDCDACNCEVIVGFFGIGAGVVAQDWFATISWSRVVVFAESRL